MRQLNNVESNQVNGAWGIPESVAAYLPASMPAISMPVISMPAISMPAIPSMAELSAFAAEIPALATAHPYIAVAATVGTLAVTTYLGYRWMK